MSIAIGIVDPRPAWCAAMAAVLIRSGLQSLRCWARIDEALAALVDEPPEVLLLSRLSSRRLGRVQMLWLKRRTRIVLVVDRGEVIGADDLPGIGIDAIVSSDASPQSISDCLSCVAAGHAWLDAALIGPLIERSSAPGWSCLSLREREVARLAARGLSNKHIARTLSLSDGTVKIHMHHILGKLRVSSREALADRLPEPYEETLGGLEAPAGAAAG